MHKRKTRLSRGDAAPSPAVVTVGDELLYGERANDNAAWMLATLRERGMAARVALSLPDEVESIAGWIARLVDDGLGPVFVSGGIGSTHDDCTREGIARALGVELILHHKCFDILRERYGDERFTPQRQRMAWLPEGAELIANPGGAPGFRVGDVYAFPGFPTMLKPMFDDVLSGLLRMVPQAGWKVEEALLPVPEGDIAGAVEEFAGRFPGTRIGLYPSVHKPGREVLVRLRYPEGSENAAAAFAAFVERLRKEL